MKKSSLILRIGDVDEHNRRVKFDAVIDQLSRGVEIVGRRVTLDTAIEKLVLREVGRNSSDKAVLPGGHSLRGGVAQDEDPRPGTGGRHISDALIAKAETVRVELVRVSQPRTDTRAVGLEGETAHRVTRKTKTVRTARNGRPQNRRGIEIIEGDECSRADDERRQEQEDLHLALPTRVLRKRVHLSCCLNRAQPSSLCRFEVLVPTDTTCEVALPAARRQTSARRYPCPWAAPCREEYASA